ncbi:hypothetical protein NKG05_07535 [Oerskovia sp. M15]
MFTFGRRRPVTYVLGQPVKTFPRSLPRSGAATSCASPRSVSRSCTPRAAR